VLLQFVFFRLVVVSDLEAGCNWNWDPKETWAFITWTIFTIYLHTRKNKKIWRCKFFNSGLLSDFL